MKPSQQIESDDFSPGELDRLIAEGEADIARGRVRDGEEVFRRLKARAKRREAAK